jgi:DNA-binding response OmpR family regulator
MKKILIVDDDVTALDIVDFLFEDNSFNVVRRPDGLSALDCVLEEAPDIVLIDLMMPKMNGQECIKQMRSKGVTCPIIAFTALDDADVHQEVLDLGGNLVLTKPCKPALLLKHVNELIA